MACQILAFLADYFAQPLLNMWIIDIIIVAPLLIASVVRRIDVDALYPALILRQQSFQGFQIIAVDNHVITAVVLGVLAHFVKAILKILLEGYTTNTVIHYHAIFGKAFKDAVRKDYLETNPMLKVDRPKKNSFRPNFYSKDEVQQLLEVSQDDPLHLCILITAYYGLRRSEVLGLKWSSVDFERKSITINHKVTEQLVNGKYVPVVSDVMKNKTSCRTLPLIPAVEEELLKQKEKQQLYRKLFKKSYSTEYLDFVCTDQEGKLIRPNFVTEHFDWLLTKYGLKHIRFHDLRHSCASLMVMNGVSMKQVQEWLGHSTFSTTADIYAHLDYKSKQGSAGVIANLLGESKLPK